MGGPEAREVGDHRGHNKSEFGKQFERTGGDCAEQEEDAGYCFNKFVNKLFTKLYYMQVDSITRNNAPIYKCFST
jgi:hypothetical protein